jgi:hypothetical protein
MFPFILFSLGCFASLVSLDVGQCALGGLEVAGVGLPVRGRNTRRTVARPGHVTGGKQSD